MSATMFPCYYWYLKKKNYATWYDKSGLHSSLLRHAYWVVQSRMLNTPNTGPYQALMGFVARP
jgi:hypothetical protein